MSFNPIDTKVVIVVTNYLFNSIYDFERNEIYKKYNLQRITPNIISADGCIPPKEIQSLFPISEYIINSKNIYISYNDLQKTLSAK